MNTSGSYTGDTTVTAGTLALGLSGIIGNSANISIAAGAFLDVSTPPGFTIGAGRALRGTGTVIGATTVNGVVAPGVGGIGQLNINSTVTWNGAVTNPWQFELGAGNTADKLHLTGDFTKGTGVDGTDFVFDFAGSTSTGTFTLVDWTGSSTFVDASFSYVNLGGGHTATFAIVAGSPNQLQVTVSGGGPGIATTTTVATSGSPSTLGQTVTFTATLAPASGVDFPTGSVQFKADGVALGSPVTVSVGSPTSNGTAATSTAGLTAVGSPHVITAEYTATGVFSSSIGTLASGQTVNTITGVAPTLTLTRNGSNNPVIGFQGIAGSSYQIQRSVDLVNWTLVDSVTLPFPGSGSYSWTDTATTVPPGKVFYRSTFP